MDLLGTLKLGKKIYVVYSDYHTDYKAVSKECVVTKLLLKQNDNICVSYDHANDDKAYWEIYDFEYALGKTVFFSKKKAENVSKAMNEIRARQKIRWAKRDEIEKENIKGLPDLDHLIGKEVMCRDGNREDRNNYRKTKIHSVFATNKLGVYGFVAYWGYYNGSEYGGNRYLFSKEGKNWYYWTKLDELKREREDINKKIAAERRAAKKEN